jgi:hypothetical protein
MFVFFTNLCFIYIHGLSDRGTRLIVALLVDGAVALDAVVAGLAPESGGGIHRGMTKGGHGLPKVSPGPTNA